jgi:nuclear transcription factor Y gamma
VALARKLCCTNMDMDSPSLAAQHLPLLSNFWQAQLQNIEQGDLDFKNYQLPLARIKKVMKTDEDVKHMMISAEVSSSF